MTTSLMVQTDRILYNLRTIKKRLGGTQMIPVISANAYGLGDIAVANLLTESGFNLVAVSRLEEALRLKGTDNNLRFLILTPYSTEAEIRKIVAFGFIATVGSNDCAVLLSGIAREFETQGYCHLRFDIGGGSSGYLPSDATKAAQTLNYLPNITVEGVYSTLSGNISEKHAHNQYQIFNGILSDLSKEQLNYGAAHLCSTAAALKFPFARLDAVRIGEGLTGNLSVKDKWDLKKVGRLVTEIADIRWVTKGHRTGSQYIKLRHNSKIATIPVGYSDGLFTGQKNRFALFGRKKSYCEIGGKRAPIVGKPGYTTTLIDVTNIDCNPGDQVSFEVSPSYVNKGVNREYV